MNILDKIIDSKRQEVEERKKRTPVSSLEQNEYFEREPHSLRQSLLDARATGIIAEFKRRSPSKGIINEDAEISQVLNAYNGQGASGISILTDEEFFGGTINDINDHRAAIGVPVLRKDFIIDEYQILESKAIGADVILLIAACLTQDEVKRLSKFARQLKLEVLLELHDEGELGHICDDTGLIGVNNRNLKTFEVNTEHSLTIAEKIPGDRIKIAESGIGGVADVAMFKRNGFKGFLIGELFMSADDPAIAFAEFVNALQQASPCH